MSSVRQTATNGKIHQSTTKIQNVKTSAASIWPRTGGMKKRKPVAVISAPLRLSGRRRQATSPKAANEPPTRL